MKRLLFCVYDSKSDQYGSPFIMESDESAKRSFLDSLAEVRMPTLLSKFPSDYELRRIGSYDTGTGIIISEARPVFIANAASFGTELANEIQRRKELLIEEHISRTLEAKYSKLAEQIFKKVYFNEIDKEKNIE